MRSAPGRIAFPGGPRTGMAGKSSGMEGTGNHLHPIHRSEYLQNVRPCEDGGGHHEGHAD